MRHQSISHFGRNCTNSSARPSFYALRGARSKSADADLTTAGYAGQTSQTQSLYNQSPAHGLHFPQSIVSFPFFSRFPYTFNAVVFRYLVTILKHVRDRFLCMQN